MDTVWDSSSPSRRAASPADFEPSGVCNDWVISRGDITVDSHIANRISLRMLSLRGALTGWRVVPIVTLHRPLVAPVTRCVLLGSHQ